MLLSTNSDRYYGSTIIRFEDKYGNELTSLQMLQSLVIVLDIGDRIYLGRDWRGGECYISQYEPESK